MWKYYNPVRVLAGAGVVRQVSEYIPEGLILLLTTGGFSRRGVTAQIVSDLGADRVMVCDGVGPNPELDELEKLTKTLREKKVSAIVALGGGSVLDTAKVLSLVLADQDAVSLANIFRKGEKHHWTDRLPLVAVPTTAGTGAEVTPFATIWDSITRKKYSLSSELVTPQFVLLDPELTVTLPHRETLFSGLDAFAHALESLWNINRNPISTSYSLHALRMANEALPIVLREPHSVKMRAKMQQSSLLAGFAISQTRTSIAHSISYPLTVHFDMPHGLACGVSLSSILAKLKDGGWSIQKEYSQLLDHTEQVITSYPLLEMAKEYCSWTDIEPLIDEMYDPARADTFIGNVSSESICSIIKQSFAD